VKRPRSLALGIFLLVFGLTAWMFVAIIWIPLYRTRETAEFVSSQETPALQVDVEREDGKGTRSWSIADQQALLKLKAGLQTAQYAPQNDPPASDQKYRLRIRRADSRIDEYEVVLGSEGSLQDRLYVLRRNGGASVYGTAFNTPELRSALQQVLVPPAPKQ